MKQGTQNLGIQFGQLAQVSDDFSFDVRSVCWLSTEEVVATRNTVAEDIGLGDLDVPY